MTGEKASAPSRPKPRKLPLPEQELMHSGHVGCLGCGACHAMRYALKATGPRTIISIPACCWAVMPGVFPNTCFNIPHLNTAFEVTGASISGIRAALDAKGIEDVTVMGWAGDGGTADIGIQALSGMVERGTRALYVMYDNEAYMNTGIQRSSSTPVGAWTTTTPVGNIRSFKKHPKKNMVEIMVAHGIPYTATCSIAWPRDLIEKFHKAMAVKGPSFIHIFAPCPTGWRYPPERTLEIARLATYSKVFPLYEVEGGMYKVKQHKKGATVKEYLEAQGRFRHLTEDEIAGIEANVDMWWRVLLAKERLSSELSEQS
jgi:2-oxoisovalerate ferredoxin oxidoreductase beta subunit